MMTEFQWTVLWWLKSARPETHHAFINSTHNRLDQVISQIAFSPFMLRFNANDAISPKWNIHQASPCLPRGGIGCFWSVKINDMCASLRVHGIVSTNRPWPLLPLVNIGNICWLILSLHHRIRYPWLDTFLFVWECVSIICHIQEVRNREPCQPQ